MKPSLVIAGVVAALIAAAPWLPRGRVGVVNDRLIESVSIEPQFVIPKVPGRPAEAITYHEIATQRINDRTIAVYSRDGLLFVVTLK